MAFKMKGHSLPGINQRKPGAPKCAAGSGPEDGCGGNFKVNKKDTNPNFVNDYNPETRSKEVLDKIRKHEY